jgi:dihydroflavonol-4-reductase
MMKALITGSNGFIGSHLVERLLNHGYQVRCLVRKTSNLRWIKDLPVEMVFGDIAELSSLLPVVADVDYVFHLSGALRANHESDFFRINQGGTRNLLEACRQQNPNLKRFIYVSTQAAAGPSLNGIPIKESDAPMPISAYGKSKHLAEQAVLEFQKFFPSTIIRPPAVYGPRDDDFLEAFKYIKFGIKPLIGKKQKFISIIHVSDLVRGIQIAAEYTNTENQIFFISNKEACSWIELENLMARVMDRKALKIVLPVLALDIAAFISEKVTKIFNKTAILNRDKANEMKQNFWLVDASKAEQKLGFVAEIPLEIGLKETYNWYRLQGWL